MYLRNYSAKESDNLQLNKESKVWVDSTTETTQEGKEGTGLENCIRVGLQANLKLTKTENNEGTENTYIGNGATLAEVTNANIGDYIDLGNNIIGTEATTDDWRILHIDGDAHCRKHLTTKNVYNEYISNGVKHKIVLFL